MGEIYKIKSGELMLTAFIFIKVCLNLVVNYDLYIPYSINIFSIVGSCKEFIVHRLTTKGN